MIDVKKLFGYIIDNGFGKEEMKVQTIDGFDRNKFNPHSSDYSLGKEMKFKRNEILKFNTIV